MRYRFTRFSRMKPRVNLDWDLLVQYVAGECTDRERDVVRAWIAVDEDAGRLLSELQRVWQASTEPDEDIDVQAVWEKLDASIRQGAKIKLLTPRTLPSRRRAPSIHPGVGGAILRVAAVVAFVAALVVLTQMLMPTRPGVAGPDEKVYVAERGQQTTIRLTDGTRVRLNVDSRLVVPATFASETRRVELEGEAYFDVAHVPSKPFTVRAREVFVEALGTIFSVSAYPEEEEVAVAVTEGEVAFRMQQRADQEAMLLASNQVGIINADKGSKRRLRGSDEVSRYLAWTERRFVFDETPLEQVVHDLERWYDVEIDLAEATLAHRQLTATFEEEPLREILKTIALTLDVQYRWEQQKVTLYP